MCVINRFTPLWCGALLALQHVSKLLVTKVQHYMTSGFQEVTFKELVKTEEPLCQRGTMFCLVFCFLSSPFFNSHFFPPLSFLMICFVFLCFLLLSVHVSFFWIKLYFHNHMLIMDEFILFSLSSCLSSYLWLENDRPRSIDYSFSFCSLIIALPYRVLPVKHVCSYTLLTVTACMWTLCVWSKV